jgi:hypothetical protein
VLKFLKIFNNFSDIAKMKNQKEEEELKYCTFQPNADKRNIRNVDETVSKLYQDGVNKMKVKKTEERKESPKKDDNSYNPKVNRL